MFRFLTSGGQSDQTKAEPEGGHTPGLSDALSAISAYAVDTAFKYGLDTSFGAVQTICAVVGILGGASAAVSVKNKFFPKAMPPAPLYDRLRLEGGPMAWPHLRINFAVSPYDKLSRDTAVILQGRPQEGKTTLLRTSVPWYRRWNVWPVSNLLLWRGIYLNGAQAVGTSFERWLTQQMFGSVPQAGSEIYGALMEYRRSQWFRRFMEKMRMPFFLPRPVIVIVDQFEQLLKHHPAQALPWADALTQEHTRNNLARVVFVVNSEAGAHSLHRLSWFGQRFAKVVLNPSSSSDLWKLSRIDRELFDACQNNVGLYKICRKALADGSITAEYLPRLVKHKLMLWDATFCLKFPKGLHPSWLEELSQGFGHMKSTLVKELTVLLNVPERTPEQNYKASRPILDTVIHAFSLLDVPNFLSTSQAEWENIFRNEGVMNPMRPGLSRIEARMVAYHIQYLLANPVPTSSAKPMWRV